jgi:hypothetical protein
MKNRQTTSRSIVTKVSNKKLLLFWQHLNNYLFILFSQKKRSHFFDKFRENWVKFSDPARG